MITALEILVAAAFVTAIIAAMNKCPIWLPIFVLCVVDLLVVWPKG
jgi:hypothetical protein